MTVKDKEQNFSWLKVGKTVSYFLDVDSKKFLFCFIVLLLIFFYDFVPAYVVGKIIDFFASYHKGDSLRQFYFYVVFVGGTWIIASMIRLYTKKAMNIMGQHARMRARTWGFERLTEFSLSWHNKENTGNKLQRIFTGADALRNFMNTIRKDLLKIGANIIGVVVTFTFVDWRFLALVVVFSLIFLYTEFTLGKKVLNLSNEFNKLNQSAGGVYVESASNMLSIKALGGEKGVIDRVRNREKISKDILIQKATVNNFKWRMLQVINGVSLSVFLLIVGVTFTSGIISIGMIVVLYTYFNRLQNSLTDISELHTDLLDARSDISQMMPIFNEVEVVKTGNDTFPHSWGKLQIKNIFMDYGSGQNGLENFNLEIYKNSKVGVAGSSGSGKSTLAKILLGLYSVKSGELKIDNKNYYDISHKEILNNITVVLQETELFNLSLIDNITMMRPLDPELLKTAIEVSQLATVIERLPEGLEAKIGEKGYMLSGGERQRLGIARAIYKNSDIVILDEATSSLDSETESKIMEQLLGAYGKYKTFLIIAHRLGTLKYTDTLAVMERGKVIEEGSYDTLMNTPNSVFAKMNKEKAKKPAKIVK